MNSAKVKKLDSAPGNESPQKRIDYNQIVEGRAWLGWLGWVGTLVYMVMDKLA